MRHRAQFFIFYRLDYGGSGVRVAISVLFLDFLV